MSNTTFDINKVVLDEIVVINAAINNNTGLSTLQKEIDHLDIQFNFSHSANMQIKKVRVVFSCDIKVDGIEKLDGKFELAYFFDVDNLEDLAEYSPGQEVVNIDDLLITALSNIVYSTSRGIIYSRCLGTIFQKVILPVIATSDLVAKL